MVRSPTGITNSIPRPLSPRRTASATPSQSSQSTKSSFHTKNSLQKSVTSMESTSTGRRRPHGELGIFSKAAVACVSPQLLQNNKAAVCMDNSIDTGVEYTGKYVPVAKAKVQKVADTVVPVVKEGAVDFAMTAAEAYRQECKSEEQNRGGDELFFQNPNATIPQEPNNSLLAGMSNRSHDGSLKSNGVFDPWDENRKESVFDLGGEEEEEVSDVHLNSGGRGGIPFTKEKRKNNNLLYRNNNRNLSNSAERSRSRGPARGRYPETNNLMARTENLTPPRVTRTENKSPLFGSSGSTDKRELRATRMELYRQGQDQSTAESRLSKALSDLDQQDTMIDNLKRQLHSTQNELDKTLTKLDQAQRISRGNSFDTAQTNQLQETVSRLKMEISTLQLQAQERDLSVMSGHPAYSASFDGASVGSKSQIMALRTEIVELKSQLAETHAKDIDDNASVRTFEELDMVKQKLRDTEAELRDIQTKEQNFHQLQQQMFVLQYEANETKILLENQLQEASTVELELREELSKTKASLQRLENEKSKKRLFDTAGGNKQLQTAREEMKRLREALGQEKKYAKEQIDKLTKDLEEVKQKLMTSEDKSVDVKSKAVNDRKKMEDGMRQQAETVKALQHQVHLKDEKMIAHLRKIAELEALLIDNGVDSSSHMKKIASLERKVVQLQSSERTLKQELELQKNLLQEERELAPKKPSGAGVDMESVRRLKERMQRFKSVESPIPTREDVDSVVRETALKKQIEHLKAEVTQLQKSHSSDGVKEEILLQEIASLKTRLRQTESRGAEEKLRSEEERRMSRDLSVGHSRELERLRKEQLETLEAKNKIEQEVIELRRKLLDVTQSNVQSAKTQAKQSEGTEVSGNVNRLRNELAIARERLVTAREQSRAYDGDSISTKNSTPQRRPVAWPESPPSPVESNFSQQSSWAPPNIQRLSVDTNQPSQTTKIAEVTKEKFPVPSPTNTVATSSTTRTKSPVVRKIVVAPTIRAPKVVTPEKSDILPRPTPPTFGSSKSRSSNADLRQRLEASRRRLDNANSKLEKLLAPGNIVLVDEEKNETLLEEVLGQ